MITPDMLATLEAAHEEYEAARAEVLNLGRRKIADPVALGNAVNRFTEARQSYLALTGAAMPALLHEIRMQRQAGPTSPLPGNRGEAHAVEIATAIVDDWMGPGTPRGPLVNEGATLLVEKIVAALLAWPPVQPSGLASPAAPKAPSTDGS